MDDDCERKALILPYDDPFGIREAELILAGQSLKVEAIIAERQWKAEVERRRRERARLRREYKRNKLAH